MAKPPDSSTAMFVPRKFMPHLCKHRCLVVNGRQSQPGQGQWNPRSAKPCLRDLAFHPTNIYTLWILYSELSNKRGCSSVIVRVM